MNAAQVLDHFDRICDAPDAIPRLRRFILDLAVRGKLVEQDPNDEPRPNCLSGFRRKRHACEGRKDQGTEALPPVTDDEVLVCDATDMGMGHAWRAVVNSHLDGGTPSTNDSTYLRMRDIYWKR